MIILNILCFRHHYVVKMTKKVVRNNTNRVSRVNSDRSERDSMSTKMIDEAFELRDTIQQLSHNKWCALTLENKGVQPYDFEHIGRKEEELFRLSDENNNNRWYFRKALFWLSQMTCDLSSVNIDFETHVFNNYDWDELFSAITFGELTESVINILTNYIDVSNINPNITNILSQRYLHYFDTTISKAIINGIYCYAWLIVTEANLPVGGDAFNVIVKTKHNLIVSSLENNTAADDLKTKVKDKLLYPPDILAFKSRIQLLPEFYGNKAKEILKRAEAEDADIIDPEKMEDGFYECKKCGKRKTKHQEMQTRSADEPMTIFVICYLCHITWKEV